MFLFIEFDSAYCVGLLNGYLTFDKDDPKWAAEYKELSELLTPQEYAQARSTVNDAFYTSPTVIERQNGYKIGFKYLP